MTKHYSEEFKKYAVMYLTTLKTEGYVEYEGNGIETVKDLRDALGVSLDSLYTWAKNAGSIPAVKETETDLKKKFESGRMSKAQQEALMPDLEYNDDAELGYDEWQKAGDLFGIRFWGFVAKNIKIPNYYKLPLAQLKYQIALRLIKQSGLGDK